MPSAATAIGGGPSGGRNARASTLDETLPLSRVALKGASPDYAGEERPDRWTLDARLEAVARRWRIEPERDLAQAAAS